MKKSIKNICRENEKECYVMDLSIEYGAGKVGREDYAIITDMSEAELKATYGDELHQYEPYVVMTMEMGEAIFEYNRNEWKNEKRQHKYGTEYSISEPDFDEHHPECAEEPDYLSCLEKSEKYAPLYEALSKLTDVQKNRIAGLIIVSAYLCPLALITVISVFASQLIQCLDLLPSAVHVAFLSTVNLSL